ncbi:MAG: crossover junction endodeoxyribonuclease RuvC, partial [Duncaniella sp.]|nr:crossover junction endodeoxyribonuclease RuvC [Duncaniella sp.]
MARLGGSPPARRALGTLRAESTVFHHLYGTTSAVTQTSSTPHTIIGIDPGTNIMGYGVVAVVGGSPRLQAMGVVRLSKFESHYQRLARIHERVSGLIAQYQPHEMAIEAPFFGKNVQSMLKLGRAQGVA